VDRRQVLGSASAALLFSAAAPRAARASGARFERTRPGRAGCWPTADQWGALRARVGGRMVKIASPWAECAAAPQSPACAELFRSLRNPFFIGDDPALTQTLGWTDAWTSRPSEYAVVAESSADVAAAVDFARRHELRLVVKGGGHSYLGGSNAPDSLLVWTRRMRAVELHDAFVPQGCEGRVAPEPAVSVGAGAIWLDVYQKVTGGGGRYAQGGGCTTVGVAGLVQGGGFGSFSKGFGTGGANVLEAEVVTADGVVRIANACANPDLFWALKGGGGGTFGVVTRLTLRTHELPPFAGPVVADITAKSDDAYRTLVDRLLVFYRDQLMNPHWGEQIEFNPGRRVSVHMVFQGLDQASAVATWRPFFDWVGARPADYAFDKPTIVAIPTRMLWNAATFVHVPGAIRHDDRPGTPEDRFFWAGDGGQVGWVIHSYLSTWTPSALLADERRPALVDAVVHAAGAWGFAFHFNKGLAGAAPAALERTRDTPMNPAVLDAFALAIAGSGEGPAYPGVAGHEPNLAMGRAEAEKSRAAMAPLMALAPEPAAYVSETDYFEADWQTAFWGEHYPRLLAVKTRYDPGGLFFVHHGVGSEAWSADGFTREA
jgi:FAD/FMN-containing dehydrogenase